MRGGRRRPPGRRTAACTDVAGVVVLLGVSIALRAALLTRHGLYRDDAWPALATRTALGRAVRLGITAPGFELFLRTWLAVSRSTPWAQLPELAASAAAAAGVYLLARRVGCDPAAALVGGGLLALSPTAVLYATRVKQYSFEAAWSVVVLACAVWAAERLSGRRRWAVLLVVVGAAGLFSSPLIAVGAVALVWVAWPDWREGGGARRRAALACGAFAVLVIGYAVLVLGSVPPSLHRLWSENYIDLSSLSGLLRTAHRVLDDLMAGFVYRHGPTGVYLLVAVFAGAVAFRPRLAVLALGPLAVALVLAGARRVPLGGGRIDEYLYPGLALAAAMAVQAVLEWGPVQRMPAALPAAVVAAGLVGFALTGGRAHVRRNPYPGVDMAHLRAAVRARMVPGDVVVVSPFSRYPWALVAPSRPAVILSRHFATGFEVRSTAPDERLMPSEYVEDGYDPAVVVTLAGDARRVWYVVTDTPSSDTTPDVQAHEGDAERVLESRGWRVVDRVGVHGGHADLLVAPGR